jgi:hypothetical protein
MKKLLLGGVVASALTLIGATAHADTFQLTSCHITGSACEGGDSSSPFGSVVLTQTTASTVQVDVTLVNGNRFVETGSGAKELFLFNFTAGQTISDISVTLNSNVVTIPNGGVIDASGPSVHADGTGNWTGSIECADFNSCNGGTTPNINDLHFTVNGATLASLEVINDQGNFFAADILCGATQPDCAGGLTGPIDAHIPVPGPALGAGIPGVITACCALWALARRRKANTV